MEAAKRLTAMAKVIWKPSPTEPDPDHSLPTVAIGGSILGVSHELQPETNAEIWAVVEQNILNPRFLGFVRQAVPEFGISNDGKIQSTKNAAMLAETPEEEVFVAQSGGFPDVF